MFTIVKREPKGNVLPQAIKVLSLATGSGFHLGAAYPLYQQSHHNRTPPWTQEFVTEIARGLKASRVTIICFALFHLCYYQVLNSLISQAGQMRLSGMSNDTVQSLNMTACVILGPLIQNVLFPFMHRRRIPFGPILRISFAFLLHRTGLIYTRAPCYDRPLACAAAQLSHGKTRPNDITVWVQIPVHFLLSMGEILGFVSLSEYTYAEAPANIKAVAHAFVQLTAAIGGVLGIALGPVAKDPGFVIMYATFAGVTGAAALGFWAVFRGYDGVVKADAEGKELVGGLLLEEGSK
ncbi:MAG: peptide transporter ptr2 [Ramalina farinacea]|uniref:Peptide transporter ptr2 n=1 Tax=Ramalina farinacea TaxID=258253 RepID=A0AA43TRI1_9LECA|nr:peptide transporter ptr2 [Ramalina farinacea]